MKLRQHWFSAVMSAVVFVFLFLPIIVVFKDAFNANKTLLTWAEPPSRGSAKRCRANVFAVRS